MDELDKYVAYYRSDSGVVERLGSVVELGCMPPEMYEYKEALVGWPEEEVSWFHKYGESFGIAKLVD
jgi:hypothetical protein